MFIFSNERKNMLRRMESPSTRIRFSLKTELLYGFQRNSRSRVHLFRNLSVTDPVRSRMFFVEIDLDSL